MRCVMRWYLGVVTLLCIFIVTVFYELQSFVSGFQPFIARFEEMAFRDTQSCVTVDAKYGEEKRLMDERTVRS